MTAKAQGFPPLKLYTSYHFGSAEHERAAIRRDDNGYTAMTPTASKTLRTQRGAEGWLTKRIGADHMKQAMLDVPDDSRPRMVKRGSAPPSKSKRGPLKPKPAPWPLREGVGAAARQATFDSPIHPPAISNYEMQVLQYLLVKGPMKREKLLKHSAAVTGKPAAMFKSGLARLSRSGAVFYDEQKDTYAYPPPANAGALRKRWAGERAGKQQRYEASRPAKPAQPRKRTTMEAPMASTKKNATKKKAKVVKMQLEVSGGTPLQGRKDKVFQVSLKRGKGEVIALGDFLAKTPAEAKRKASTQVRRQIGAC